jgi:hypothetical protein
MLRKDFILCKTRNLLREFMAPIIAHTDKPRQKFLPQAVGAILLSGSLVVTDIARWIHDDCSDVFYRLKRLLNHLVSPRGELDEAAKSYLQAAARHIQPDTPIVIDLTDLARPRARKMKYLAYVRDGSEHRLVPGYWCVEVYAHLKKRRIMPLAMDAFSIEDPAVGSQNLQINRTVQAVHRAIGNKGIWVADRGFDGLNMYETWFSLNCHFVVRQRGDRCVITHNGVRIIQRDLVERIRHRRAAANLSTDIVFTRVYLPGIHKPLYLVASWKTGVEEPLILLTTLVVENEQQARQILWYYKQRWSCEEVSRFLKGRIGLERFRIRRYEAIQRLMILAMFAMGFLTWVLLRSHQLASGLFSFTSRFRKKTKFVYYRLLDGLQELARLYRLRLGKITLEPLKNG